MQFKTFSQMSGTPHTDGVPDKVPWINQRSTFNGETQTPDPIDLVNVSFQDMLNSTHTTSCFIL